MKNSKENKFIIKFVFFMICAILLIWFYFTPANNYESVKPPTEFKPLPITPKTEIVPKLEFKPISTIYIHRDVKNQLEAKWDSNHETEFEYCIDIQEYEDSYIITNAYEPAVEFSTKYEIRNNGCFDDAAGTIHSHPIGSCLLSTKYSAAIKTIDSDKEQLLSGKYPIMGIMCDPGKIAVYTKKHTTETIQLVLVESPISRKDITVVNPCRGNRYCNGECWLGCTSSGTWSCRLMEANADAEKE